MIQPRPFTVAPEDKVFKPGTPALVTLTLAALVAVAYLINPGLVALDEICSRIGHVSIHTDARIKPPMACMIGYLLVKLFSPVKRFLHPYLRL